MPTSILRDSTTSLYEQIAHRLLEEIQRGDFEPSGKLPSGFDVGNGAHLLFCRRPLL